LGSIAGRYEINIKQSRANFLLQSPGVIFIQLFKYIALQQGCHCCLVDWMIRAPAAELVRDFVDLMPELQFYFMLFVILPEAVWR
jgi:hypothetical protein